MVDPLEFLLPIVESKQPAVGYQEANCWPAGVLEKLIELGILVQAEDMEKIRCPQCGEHYEKVIARDGPKGSTQLFISCPEVLRVEVSSQHRMQWRPALSAFARLLAESLNLTGKPAQLCPERLWRLGRMTWEGRSRDVLFVRGLRWQDGDQLRSKIVRTRTPVVFSSTYSMPEDFWKTVPPQLVLRDVAWLTDRIEVDPGEVIACLTDASVKRTESSSLNLSTDELNLRIRRQIKAENKTELIDEVFVMAYRQEGSLRNAAEYLTKQTGQTVTKDKIARAVARNGGPESVLRADNSDSIVRDSASQRRDSKGKILISSKP
jgi:hypothetical protein